MHRRSFIHHALGFNLFWPTILAGCNMPGETATDSTAPIAGIQPDMPAEQLATPEPEGQITPTPVQPLNIDLALAAENRTRVSVTYDPAYVALSYPMGDVANDRGVCADLVIRAYRSVGYDLQQLVHEDMRDHFDAYPRNWGLSRTDTNIDHRRVPNLETFLTRRGASLDNLSEHELEPGDLVTWRIDNRLPHIGIATTISDRAGRRVFAHNIGAGPQLQACFDAWPRTAIFRFRPWQEALSTNADETDL